MTKQEISLTVNGKKVCLEVSPTDLLLNVLRDKLYLTGSKYGCGIGECGACTILVDGRSYLSCLILAVEADGWNITTIEGLAEGDKLTPLQQAFIDEGAIQCGYCTPGMVMTSTALLNENPSPNEEYIKDYLRGNHCRCTGYIAIVKAVQKAALHHNNQGV